MNETCLLFVYSFDIILTCGHKEEKDDEDLTDVALKLSVRFAERQYLRSARVSGKWSEEEAVISYFPFIPDQPFRVKSVFHFSFRDLLCISFLIVASYRVTLYGNELYNRSG